MKKILFFVCLLGGIANADIPKYNVNEMCKEAAIILGGLSTPEIAFNECIGEQQKAYNELKTRWETLTEGQKRACNTQVNHFMGDYENLLNCVNMETSGDKVEFEF